MKNTRKPRSRAQRDSKPLGKLPASAQTDSQVSQPDKPPVAVSDDGSVLSGKALTTELQANLPTDSAATVKRFQTELERLRKLDEFFQTYPADKEGFEDSFGKSEWALDYKRHYDISLAGLSGAGKSALTNLLLDRKLSSSRMGAPVTGTLLRFRHSVSPGESEKAVISYRDPDNLFSLIQREFEHFNLTLTSLESSNDVKAELVETLDKLQLSESTAEATRVAFSNARQAIVGVVQLYFEHSEAIEPSKFTRTFPVSNPREIEALNSHLSEVSGIIKEVNYYLEFQSEGTSLKLPTNVCLVDLPGEFGEGAHEFVIDDSLPDAGAVVFLTRSPRTGKAGEVNLAKRVHRCLNVLGGSDSSDKVFLVLNANEGESREELEEGLKPTIAALFPKKVKPHFHISLKPGEEEGVPELIEELKTFTSKTLLGGRIADGRSAINAIVEELKNRHTERLNSLRPPVEANETKARKELEEREKTAKISLGKFRTNLLDKEEELKAALKEAGTSICQQIEDKIPEIAAAKDIWNIPYHEDRLRGENIGKVELDAVLTAVGAAVWKALPEQLKSFAKILAERSREEFSNVRVDTKDKEPPTFIEFCNFQSLVPEESLPEESLTEKQMRGVMEDMAKNLENFSKFAGLPFITKDEYSLIRDPGDEEPDALADYDPPRPGGSAPSQGRPTAKEVKGALPAADNPNPAEADFKEFGRLARARYENAVLEDTVEAFFHVFKYQLLLAQESLERYLAKSITHLISECEKNSELCEVLLRPSQPEDAQKIEELEAKIRMLAEI